MSERRLINVFNPRLTIPIAEMLEYPEKYAFYCLPVDGANALRRIIAYLNREVTYFYEVVDSKSYLGPTEQELQDFRDLAAETEDFLMNGCDLTDITDAIDRLTSAVSSLQCICVNLQLNRSQGTFGDDIMELIDNGEVIPSDQIPETTFPPQAQEEACAIAQLYFNWTWEVITETVLPALRGTFDHLVPVLAALASTATGGIGFIPMYLIAEFIQEIIEIGYNAAETNLINWLWSVKEDWICLAYQMLLDGATDRAIADAVKVQITDVSQDISFGDKVIVSAIGAAWSVKAASVARANNTVWAQQNVEAGYCDVCAEPPDPQCISVDCEPSHWLDTGHPEWLSCEAGKPYCSGGYIRWIESTLPCPAENFTLEVTWTAKGDGDWAQIGIDLFYVDGWIQKNVDNSQQLTTGQTVTEKWHLYSNEPDGEAMTIQFVQVGWWGVIDKWCLRPGHT